jgi:hypothetical protein
MPNRKKLTDDDALALILAGPKEKYPYPIYVVGTKSVRPHTTNYGTNSLKAGYKA